MKKPLDVVVYVDVAEKNAVNWAYFAVPIRICAIDTGGRLPIGEDQQMDELTTDAVRLRDELRATDPKPNGIEQSLLNALEPFIKTLEIDGQPQRGSTDTLSRFSVDSLNWSSNLYDRCTAILEQARTRL